MSCSTVKVPSETQTILDINFASVVFITFKTRAIHKCQMLNRHELRFYLPFISRLFAIAPETVRKVISETMCDINVTYNQVNYSTESAWTCYNCNEIDNSAAFAARQVLWCLFRKKQPKVNNHQIALDEKSFTTFREYAAEPRDYVSEATIMLRLSQMRELNVVQLNNDEEKKLYGNWEWNPSKSAWIDFMVRNSSIPIDI